MVEDALDLVIVGSGIGGLATGIEAVKRNPDASVAILEKGPRPGGTSYLSGGAFYCFESVADLEERDPPGNRELQRLVVEGHIDAWNWLERHGVPLRDVGIDEGEIPPEIREVFLRKPVAKRTDPAEMIAALVDTFERNGGELYLRTPMTELRYGNGRVTGVMARTTESNELAIESDAVVLATGGFIGNEEMIERYITEHTEDLWLRGCRWCTGDGIIEATRVGAKLTKGMSDFYGKSMISPPARFTPREYPAVTAYYGPFAVAVNANGERFADESASVHEKTVVKTATERGYGRIYYLFDRTLLEYPSPAESPIRTILDVQREKGGRVAECRTLEELKGTVLEWGVDGDRALKTLREYNEAIDLGRPDSLSPPRENNHTTVDRPPFFAVEVQPSITMTVGGLAVDRGMRVLHRGASGTTFDHGGIDQENALAVPIPGLYAVGADVGYVGGIALMEEVSPMTAAIVFGRIAGGNAVPGPT